MDNLHLAQKNIEELKVLKKKAEKLIKQNKRRAQLILNRKDMPESVKKKVRDSFIKVDNAVKSDSKNALDEILVFAEGLRNANNKPEK